MRPKLRWLIVVALAVSTLGLWPSPALARPLQANIVAVPKTPNIFTDEFDADTTTGQGCSLREAIELFAGDNVDRGCGSLAAPINVFDLHLNAGTYQLTLTGQLASIPGSKTLNILDTGATIDGGSQSANRHDGIFDVEGGTLNLRNITLRHGSRAAGGAIWLDSGTLTADNVKFIENDAAADPQLAGTGGALMVDSGVLTVTNSLFQSNHAYDTGGATETEVGYFYKDTFIGNQASRGGAVYIPTSTTDPVIFFQSTFKQNLAKPQLDIQKPITGYDNRSDTHGGGAIFNNGHLQLTRVILDGNATELNRGGGGLLNAGQAQVLESAIFNNTAFAESNGFIDFGWGGGIFNSGDLELWRSSVYNNQADLAAAIFNHGGGDLQIYNSTVSNNTAKSRLGGLVNEHAWFDPSVSNGAQIHLLHATIGLNYPDIVHNQVYALHPYSIQFGNSIIAGGCNMPQYTIGNSAFYGACDTVVDPSVSPQLPNGDITNTDDLQLQPLAPGDLPLPEIQVQRIPDTSAAAGIGRDDVNGCGNAFILHQDQNRAPRPMHACDAGAIQAGAPPANFDSTPAPGLGNAPGTVKFPVVNLALGPGVSLATLTLKNTGGGELTYQVVDEGGSGYIVNDTGAASSGFLLKNQQATIQFSCHPSVPGYYFRNVTVETDAPNRAQADYRLHCTAIGTQQVADPDTPPGPANLPATPPGQTAHTNITVNNPGPQPLAVQPALSSGGPFALQATALDGPASPAATLNPGQTLHLDVSCTPPGPGLFFNTLVITSNDPINPVLQYDLACEGQVTSPPEPLSAGSSPNDGAVVQGVAVSPDGLQVLDGQFSTDLLDTFVRDPATGDLSSSGSVGAAGMSAIQSIHYSHDGHNVYYTSADGNGVVTLDRAGNNTLSVSQVMTTGTSYICGFANLHFVFCPIGTMHGADGLVLSPDDQFVYVVGFYDNSLTAFQRQANGQLALWQTLTSTVSGLGGPVKVAISPDGQNLYVASYLSSTVAVFQRDAAGTLNFQAVYTNATGSLTNPGDVAVSPDGDFVYVSAATSGAVNVFQRSQADGGLTPSSVLAGVSGAWGLAISPDEAGRRLFLTQTTANSVRVYGRSQITGGLSFVGANAVNAPVFLADSPDDLDVYASLNNSQGMQHFQTVRNAPVISHLSPASAVVGGGAFTLTVSGGRFYPGSQVVWNLFTPVTVFVSQHELQAQIPAGNISALGAVTVTVVTPGPGVGFSNAMSFAITAPAQPPVPSIDSLDPPAASFGGDDLVVQVHGANFAPNAQVYYNHVQVPTLFITDQLLQITLSAEILTTPGDGGLEVVNGGGAPTLSAPEGPAAPTTSSSSAAVSFSISPPGVPAVPSLTRLQPASVLSGTAAIWVRVVGHNFSLTTPSVGRWNGHKRTSVVLDAQTLLLGLSAADLAAPGNNALTVLTPGHGESAPLNFRVRPPGEKPVPTVTGEVVIGWTLYVNGNDFVPGAQLRINGAARASTFVSGDQLKASLTVSDHGLWITVTNPGPGGGLSNGLAAFVRRLFLPLARR